MQRARAAVRLASRSVPQKRREVIVKQRYTHLLALSAVLCLPVIASAQQSPLLWAAAEVSRPAARVRWDLDWGQVWRDDSYLIGAPFTGNQLADVARILVESSKTAYASDPVASSRKLGLTLLGETEGSDQWLRVAGIPVAKTTPRAVVVLSELSPRAPAAVVVAVRGTDSFPDVIQDLSARAAEDRRTGETFHQGFLDLANEIYVDIRTMVDPYCGNPKYKLWLTGHSLGGAAAQILAYQLAQDGCYVQGVMTFAAPTPGQDDFRDEYADLQGGRLFRNTHRFVHEYDVVPCVPAGNEWKDVGIRHATYGGDFVIAADSALGVKITGENLPAGNPRGNPKCEDEGSGVLNFVRDRINDTIDVVQEACPDSTGARIFWGVVTGGASEISCTTSEYSQAASNAAEQFADDLFDVLDGDAAYASHKLGEGYLPQLRQRTGEDLSSFGW